MSDVDRAQLEQLLRSCIQLQNLNHVRVAALSELGDRVLAADPSATQFVHGLVDLAEDGRREAIRTGSDDVPWMALAQLLRESALTHEKRSSG